MMTVFWMIAKDWLQLRRYHKKDFIALRQHGRNLVHFPGNHQNRLLHLRAGAAHLVQRIALVASRWPDGCVMQMAGFLLAVIFQPAHVMEHHDYTPAVKGAKLDVDPLTHQLRTTSNFGTGSGC